MAQGVWLGLAMLVATWADATAGEDGARLYADNCSACNQVNGQGTPSLAPPLASPVLRAGAADYAARVVLNGLSGPITADGQPFVSAMRARADLADGEIAAIVAHVLVDLNGIAADGVGQPDDARIAALRQDPVSHAALRRLRAAFTVSE